MINYVSHFIKILFLYIIDENGQYDVKDLLELMKNKEELEKKR